MPGPNFALWPELPLDAWRDTYVTLHMWTQIVGKIRLKLSPNVNHWWSVALYVTTRGLTTSPIPYQGRTFEIQYDFVDHVLIINTQPEQRRAMSLSPKPVALFYSELMNLLHSLNIEVQIDLNPKEVPNPIPFDQDFKNASYDPHYAQRLGLIFHQADRLLKRFRSGFIGKCSPVHFFWGTFDLAVTLFSGRAAPPRPNADHITQEAYSHECMSCGFWPGSGNIQEAAFYAYAAPEPAGFSKVVVKPEMAFYNPTIKNFILTYENVCERINPDRHVLDFFHSTYEAAADLGHWDRNALEKPTVAEKSAA